MGAIASQITSLTIVYSKVYSDADQRKHQSCASLAFVRGIHRGPVNSPHKWPVTRKMFPFDDVIMLSHCLALCWLNISWAQSHKQWNLNRKTLIFWRKYRLHNNGHRSLGLLIMIIRDDNKLHGAKIWKIIYADYAKSAKCQSPPGTLLTAPWHFRCEEGGNLDPAVE